MRSKVLASVALGGLLCLGCSDATEEVEDTRTAIPPDKIVQPGDMPGMNPGNPGEASAATGGGSKIIQPTGDVTADLASAQTFDFDFANLKDADGKEFSLTDYKGKVVVVDIWGIWCPPCVAEIPSLIKIQEDHGDKGLQFIGLTYGGGGRPESPAKMKKFGEDKGVNYPLVLGEGSMLDSLRKQGFRGFPTKLFIGRDGKVRIATVGGLQHDYVEGLVAKLLEEDA